MSSWFPGISGPSTPPNTPSNETWGQTIWNTVRDWIAVPFYNTDSAQRLLAQAKNTVVQQVQNSVTQQSNPIINQLLDSLKMLKDTVENKLKEETGDDPEVSIPLEQNTKVLELLEKFLRNHKTILEGARNRDETFLKFSDIEEKQFRNLLAAAQHNRYDSYDVTLIEKVTPILDQAQSSQMGLLQKALSFAPQGGFTAFLESLGLANGNASDESKISQETEKAQKELLQSVIPEPELIDPPNDLNKDLSKKLDEIKDIAIKMVLTQLILPDDKKTFYTIYGKARIKHGIGEDFDQAFFKELESAFLTNEKSQSIFEKTRYWFHLNITAPLLKLYIGAMVARFKEDLNNFLTRSPEQRINDVFTVILNPLKAHMTAFYTCNRRLAGEQFTKTIDESNQTYFSTIDFGKGETIDTILAQFAHMIIERYATTISWTKEIENRLDLFQSKVHLAIPFTKWNVLTECMTAGKVCVVWSSFLLTGIFEWALNSAIKYKLKKELKNVVKLNFFETGNTELKTHSRYQHIINQFIATKLRLFNANGITSTHAPTKLRSSPTKQEDLQSVISELFGKIPLSIATNTTESLIDYFQRGPLQQGKQETYKFFVDQFTPTVSLELLKGMEHFLYDDKPEGKSLGLLSEFIWYAVNNLANTLKTNAENIDPTQMTATENQMYEELHETVRKIVKEAVETALDPSKKYQNETGANIGGLKRQANVFLESAHGLDLGTFTEQNGKWKELTQAVIDIEVQFRKTSIKKIKHEGSTILIQYNTVLKTLTPILDKIEESRKEKVLFEGQLKELSAIAKSISERSANQKTPLLSILSKKTGISETLKNEIEWYKSYLETFSITRPNDDVLRLQVHRLDDFMQKVDDEEKKLLQKIKMYEFAMQKGIEEFKKELPNLQKWIETLKPISITSEDVTSAPAKLIKTTGLPAEKYAAKAVMYCVLELLKFKQKSYHWDQVLIRAMRASTTLR